MSNKTAAQEELNWTSFWQANRIVDNACSNNPEDINRLVDYVRSHQGRRVLAYIIQDHKAAMTILEEARRVTGDLTKALVNLPSEPWD